MASKITFLGTGGDSFVVGKQTRASGGIVLQSGGYQFHIDPGPGALVRAAQFDVNLRANTAILVSNPDLFHSNDVNAVISAMTYDGFDKQGVLISNESFVKGLPDQPSTLRGLYANCVERIIVAKPGNKIGIEDIEVHTLATKNEDESAVGFKFLTSDFVLSYSSDTSYSKEVVKQYVHSDILILNVLNPGDNKDKNHLCSEDAVKIIDEIKPSLVIITHFGKKMLSSDPLYEAREIQKKTGVQVISATDGLVITPDSYSAGIKQKTLNLYPDEDPADGDGAAEEPAPEEPVEVSEEVNQEDSPVPE